MSNEQLFLFLIHKCTTGNALYFLTFSTVEWIDVFTRKTYRDIVVDSLAYCQKEKGLLLYSWCIMSNHVHMVAKAKEGYKLSGILRDLKKQAYV